jgi:hypothetical protein
MAKPGLVTFEGLSAQKIPFQTLKPTQKSNNNTTMTVKFSSVM